jgi:lipopolysaccharide/colanic/teichoic acid biosynthesis glycosyltransferase
MGMNERFYCYKFRTMQIGSETQQPDDILTIKRLSDPRIIPSRRWMRRVGFDELPQLINVFKGEMNFFGARPLAESLWVRLNVRQKELRKRSKPGCFGPYGMLRKGRNEWNLLKANDAYLILAYRKARQGRLALLCFNAFVFWRTIVAIVQGRVV